MKIINSLKSIQAAMPHNLLGTLDIKAAAMVSPSTLKLTLKTPAPDGTNQVELTVRSDGNYKVRGYKVEETETFDSIPCENVANVLRQMTGKTNGPALNVAELLKQIAGQ